MSSIRAKVAGVGVLAAVLVAGLILPSTASATTATTDQVQAAAGWLTTQFEDGTHLPAPAGDHFDSYFSPSYFANQGENADVVFALAAAKAGATKSAVALDYLAANISDYADLPNLDGFGPADGALGKAALAAIVSGRSATSFGGVNLLQQLKNDECAPVSPATTCSDSSSPTVAPGAPKNIFSSQQASFVILAEARTGGAYSPSANAMTYFLSLQCTSGGFTGGTSACGTGTASIDETAFAIMALQAAGGHATELNNAVSWLSGQRSSDGSWNSANVNSTGVAAAALSGLGVDTSLSKAWLLGQQVPAGAVGAGALKYAGAFTPTALAVGTSPSVLATAQALTGLVKCGSLATLTAAGSSAGVSLFAASASAGSASVVQGATQTVTGTGFAAGEQVAAALNSATVGTATADASGSVSFSFTVPASVPVGSSTVTLTGASSGLTATTAAFAVVAPAAASAVDATAVTADAPALANTGTNEAALRDLALVAGFALLAGTGLVTGGVIGARRRRIG